MNKQLLLTLVMIFGLGFTIPTIHIDNEKGPAFEWGKPVTLLYNGSINLPRPIQIKEGGLVAIQERREDNLVDFWFHFDEKYNKVKGGKMAFNRGTEGSSRKIIDYLIIDEQVHLLYETWKKNTFEHAINRVELKPNGEPTIRKSTVDQIYASKENNIGKFTPLLSKNKDNLLIFNQKPYDKKLNERGSIRVYNTDTWKLSWKSELNYDHLSGKNTQYSPAIGENGDVCFFKMIRDKKLSITQFQYANKNQKKYSHNVDLEGRILTDVKVGFTKKGMPIAIGVYEILEGKNKRSYGIMQMLLTADGKSVASQEFIDIENDEEHFNINMNYDANSENNISNGVKLNGFFEKSNGQILILTEIFQTEKQLINTKDRWIPNNVFEHGNVFIHCLSPEGLINWESIHNKYQKETSGEAKATFSSILPYFVKDELYLIWNSTELVLPFSSWEEEGNEKTIFKKDLFGGSTYYPTFMEVYKGAGKKRYGHLKYGLPLADMHKNSREMLSLRPDLSLASENGLILVAQASVSPGIFRIGEINFAALKQP